jgi:ribonuclease HII
MTAVLPTAARRAPVPGLGHERAWWDQGAVVAGVDEVGRGALAGPVTYCAVVLPRDRRLYKLRDSKVLDPDLRRDMAGRIAGFALGIGIGQASNDEIDRVGMTVAIQRAARRAVDALPLRPDVLLIDGNWDFLRGYGTTNELLVRGDGRSASIAAASIVAKVTRDALMAELCPGYPAYRFSSNKGYSAPAHLRSLRTWGPCALHRRTWAPVRVAEDPTLFVLDDLDAIPAPG